MFHCIAVGGLPPAMRFSAAACSACGPTEASSIHLPPRLSYSLANTATARDSPPLVHQCMTSASCAAACWLHDSAPASTAATVMGFHIPLTSPQRVYDSGYIQSRAPAPVKPRQPPVPTAPA